MSRRSSVRRSLATLNAFFRLGLPPQAARTLRRGPRSARGRSHRLAQPDLPCPALAREALPSGCPAERQSASTRTARCRRSVVGGIPFARAMSCSLEGQPISSPSDVSSFTGWYDTSALRIAKARSVAPIGSWHRRSRKVFHFSTLAPCGMDFAATWLAIRPSVIGRRPKGVVVNASAFLLTYR